MDYLTSDWFLHGWIDYEYQTYRLLAYLQKVYENYLRMNLYPQLQELVKVYYELENLENHLSKIKDINELSSIILDIIQFSIPKIDEAIKEGITIYNLVKDMIYFEPIGIVPLYKKDGYLFIHRANEKIIHVYLYESKEIYDQNEKLLALHLQKQTEEEYSPLLNSVSHIKEKIIKNGHFMQPLAFFLSYIPLQIPIDSTILPIIKRDFMVKYIFS